LRPVNIKVSGRSLIKEKTMIGKTIDEMQIGDTAEFTKTVTETDVYLYAGVTGDLNPAHINETFAKTTPFKGRIVHGMLSAGLISAVFGVNLPGAGTIYVSQNLEFKRPVRIADTITARVEIIEKNPEKNRVTFRTTCLNQDGKVVVDGEAVVLPPLPLKS
jgi:3-hydroxybutyryl-CoA dehydratase